MATVVQVHGTFASGEETGDKWWQAGSPFEKELRRLVDAEGGALSFVRIHWDGRNAEDSRRSAAGTLHAQLLRLEAAGEPYCVIGHSHGGSIVLEALALAAGQRKELPCLRRWISVGTPFISFRKERLLYSRIGRTEKALLIAAFTLAVAVILGSMSSVALPWSVFFWILGFVPLGLLYLVFHLRDRRRYGRYSPAAAGRIKEFFEERWLGLWHRSDEAVTGLHSLGTLDRRIFRPQFAAPMLSALSIFVPPLLVLWGLSNATLMGWLFETHLAKFPIDTLEGIAGADGNLAHGGSDVGTNFALVTTFLWEMYKAHLATVLPIPSVLFLLVLLPLAFCGLVAVLALPLLDFLARIVSPGLSSILNKQAWGQIRQTGFGSNITGERAFEAADFPRTFSRSFPSLPAALELDIQRTSDAAAANAVSKFRSAVSDFALAGDQEKADMVAEYLSWRELIHTTYFFIPKFVKLVAFAISQADGFRATEAFRSDEDYDLVEKWYRELTTDARSRRSKSVAAAA